MEDTHVTGKERHGESIAKLRTSPTRTDSALPAGSAALPSLQGLARKGQHLPRYIQQEFDGCVARRMAESAALLGNL